MLPKCFLVTCICDCLMPFHQYFLESSGLLHGEQRCLVLQRKALFCFEFLNTEPRPFDISPRSVFSSLKPNFVFAKKISMRKREFLCFFITIFWKFLGTTHFSKSSNGSLLSLAEFFGALKRFLHSFLGLWSPYVCFSRFAHFSSRFYCHSSFSFQRNNKSFVLLCFSAEVWNVTNDPVLSWMSYPSECFPLLRTSIVRVFSWTFFTLHRDV